MSTSDDLFDAAITSVTAAIEQLPTELATVRALDDSALLEAQHRLASARTKLDACASLLAWTSNKV